MTTVWATTSPDVFEDMDNETLIGDDETGANLGMYEFVAYKGRTFDL